MRGKWQIGKGDGEGIQKIGKGKWEMEQGVKGKLKKFSSRYYSEGNDRILNNERGMRKGSGQGVVEMRKVEIKR